MKYFLLLVFFFFSCTKEPLRECGTIIAKQLIGTGGAAGSQKIYIWVQHDSTINRVRVGIMKYEQYKIGDTYCE